MKKIRVIIVDDSAFIRQMFTDMLSSDPEIEVIATANDPYDAREKIKQHHPDVITLDIEMPKMDGITFLEKIMALRPMPVVMVSSLTQKGAEVTLRALELGAVDYVCKPATQQSTVIYKLKHELIVKVKAAAAARLQIKGTHDGQQSLLSYHGNNVQRLIAIGSSTGGVEALREVLTQLPPQSPAVVITQHMPESFTTSFAARLDRLCAMQVHEAKDGQKIAPGNVYIAPGGYHMEVHGTIGNLYCHIHDGPQVSGHRPSVDVLFSSIAKHVGHHAVGIILTGMGKDGAQGLLAMKNAGAPTIGQNERSCVVYGMPKAAMAIGAVDTELTLEAIAAAALQSCNRNI